MGWIKINTDAAISNNVSALAAIARNTKGEVLQVWTKLHISHSPLQAEASAILWAIQLAQSLNWDHIIFEVDAKDCFDPISPLDFSPNWTISNLISNLLSFVRDILDILAQCNRPKPTLTCTSSLGFSRLYILML